MHPGTRAVLHRSYSNLAYHPNLTNTHRISDNSSSINSSVHISTRDFKWHGNSPAIDKPRFSLGPGYKSMYYWNTVDNYLTVHGRGSFSEYRVVLASPDGGRRYMRRMSESSRPKERRGMSRVSSRPAFRNPSELS